MTDALTLLKNRRSIPSAFLGAPGPAAHELREILTVGARVPDHGKLVPWRFVVVGSDQGARAGARLAELYRDAHGEEAGAAKAEEIEKRYATVPTTVLVVSTVAAHPKIPEWEQFICGGGVAMNLLHGAHALGYGGQWLSGFVAENPAAAAVFGVESPERIVAAVHIGTPSMPPSERPRPDLDAITTHWRAG